MSYVAPENVPFEALEGLGSTSKCGPLPPRKSPRLADANPEFRREIERLQSRLKQLGLPFAIRTVHRSWDSQCWAICAGGSELKNPTDGAHTKVTKDGRPDAFAVDFKIVHPAASSGWDVGLDKETHTKITNSTTFALWSAFGNVIRQEFPKLTWGGDWKSRYVGPAAKIGKSRRDILIGFDPYHVELKNYRSKADPQPYVRCVGPKAVPAPSATQQGAAAGIALLLAVGGWFYLKNR